MSELMISIVGGLAILIVGTWLGIGGTTKVAIHNGYEVKKTGK